MFYKEHLGQSVCLFLNNSYKDILILIVLHRTFIFKFIEDSYNYSR